MNLTITQAIERTKDLSGEIKAADEMQRLTADTLSAKEHEVTLARQAHDKAVEAAQARRDEREALAGHIAALVRTIGDPPPLALEDGPAPELIVVGLDPQEGGAPILDAVTPWLHDFDCATNQVGNTDGLCTCSGRGFGAGAFNSIFTEGADFQAQALENGLSRITDAFNRSTQ